MVLSVVWIEGWGHDTLTWLDRESLQYIIKNTTPLTKLYWGTPILDLFGEDIFAYHQADHNQLVRFLVVELVHPGSSPRLGTGARIFLDLF